MEEIQAPDIIVKVTIDGHAVQRNLSDDLRVDEEHINNYLLRSPAITAYWNMLYEKARSSTQRSKVAMERKRAELDKKFRLEARFDKKKAVNAEVEASIIGHSEYIQLEDEYLNRREDELSLKSAVEAIKEHRSMLISLSANMRSSGTIKVSAVEEQYRKKFANKE